ncbi:MAG: hypothetical protein Ct9H90mP2_04130 [Dehalococcoidia bacterium]|nr:MAG: hypothetical protein Ct9H90mP2_04130 [Dehalococcoidia bacterium]
MKIEKVESLLSGNSHFVRIVTDNGIEGLAVCMLGIYGSN